MALLLDKDPNTGVEINNMYYRIDKVNFNDFDFQVVVTGYASEQAYLDKMIPVSNPRAYTFGDLNKELLSQSNVYEFAYNLLKSHEDFKAATDI